VRIEEPQQQAYLVAAEDELGRALILGIDGLSPFVRLATLTGEIVPLSSGELRLGEWHHVALRAGDGRLNLFVDGEDVAGMDAELPEIAAPVLVGRSAEGTNGFRGELDELAISNTVRSADWLKAAAASQGMFGNLVSYGADAQRESGGGVSYFAVTLRNVTTDGWVVIFILGVMFAISIMVMVGKAFLLSRVEGQNRLFLAAYRRLGTGGDLLSLANAEDEAAAELGEDSPLLAALHSRGQYRPSTLFPVYMAGVNEVKHRLQSPAIGAQRRGFAAETIGAIRATVDAVFVHERQKLNKQMVLLTIAISGGPFLGLLGTVVGVMITFAAIAASGDVNVNAIAPGIAAALVATVAGLAVAIPALFGYNWLGSRIRDIDAETHVFADEFVNRIAENYA
jgi:biopolymer transport protein ExbB